MIPEFEANWVLNKSNETIILTRYVHGGVFARPKLGDTHGGAQVSERVGERRPGKPGKFWKWRYLKSEKKIQTS